MAALAGSTFVCYPADVTSNRDCPDGEIFWYNVVRIASTRITFLTVVRWKFRPRSGWQRPWCCMRVVGRRFCVARSPEPSFLLLQLMSPFLEYDVGPYQQLAKLFFVCLCR